MSNDILKRTRAVDYDNANRELIYLIYILCIYSTARYGECIMNYNIRSRDFHDEFFTRETLKLALISCYYCCYH